MQDGNLELQKYWRLFRGWWWLFVLATVGAVVVSYYVSSSTVPMYQSVAKVLVERNQLPGAPSQGDQQLSEVLALNYVDIVKTRPVLDKISQRLPETGVSTLEGMKISVTSFRNVIAISVHARNPQAAAIVANTTADTFIRELQERQLSQLADFQRTLNEFGIDQDDNIVSSQAAMLGVLTIIEPAFPARGPSNINTLRDVLIAGFVGLLAAALGVLAISYLDNRIRTPGDLKQATGLVSLGSIPLVKAGPSDRIDAVNGKHALSPLRESYKLLWTNLEFSSRDRSKLKTLLVTSSGVSEGKTEVASNLAVSAARHGRSVILVDCDLRGPSIDRVFDSNGHSGLSQLLMGAGTLDEALAPTPVEGLQVISGGPILPDPDGVLSSPAMNTLLQDLKKRVDLVILDSPPVLAVTDPLLLAPLVDVVLLVIDTNRTSREVVNEGLGRLLQIDAYVAGGVLNKVKGKGVADKYRAHYRKYFEEHINN